jgi:CO/xanthine dehydrogenase FAD-binding subunit
MFRYERPTTASEAAELLASAGPRARVLAGGTDLMVALRAGAICPDVIVDIKRIAGIDEIAWNEEGELVIGAAVTMRRLAEDTRIREAFPALAEGADAVGSLQVRCRATLGGNLANASPCMDTAPPLLVYGARVCLQAPESEREIPLSELFLGVKRTLIQPDELLSAVVVPTHHHSVSSGFDKIKRVFGHDLALVNAAAAYSPAHGALRAAVGSCGITPILLPVLEDVAPGADLGSTGERLAALALDHIAPIDDVRSSAEYRRDMTALLCRRLAARVLATPAGRA